MKAFARGLFSSFALIAASTWANRWLLGWLGCVVIAQLGKQLSTGRDGARDQIAIDFKVQGEFKYSPARFFEKHIARTSL